MRYLIETKVLVQNGNDVFTATRTIEGDVFDNLPLGDQYSVLHDAAMDGRAAILPEIEKANRVA